MGSPNDPTRRGAIDRVRSLAGHSATRYLVVGGSSFVVDFVLVWLLRDVVGWPTFWASAVAFLLTFGLNYSLQRVVSFRSSGAVPRSLLRYTALVAFNTVATAGIVAAIDLTPAGWQVGKIVSTAVVTAWNYFAYRYWVFAHGPQDTTITETRETY